jgi:hypothetical protein
VQATPRHRELHDLNITPHAPVLLDHHLPHLLCLGEELPLFRGLLESGRRQFPPLCLLSERGVGFDGQLK